MSNGGRAYFAYTIQTEKETQKDREREREREIKSGVCEAS